MTGGGINMCLKPKSSAVLIELNEDNFHQPGTAGDIYVPNDH